MSHIEIIASQLNIRPNQVAATIELLDDGNTLPFIARYRKEATGGLDEVKILKIEFERGRISLGWSKPSD